MSDEKIETPELEGAEIVIPAEDLAVEGEVVEGADKKEEKKAPAAAAEDADAEAAKADKKAKTRGDRRVQNLTARAHEAETTAERLARENEELKRERATLVSRVHTTDAAAMTHYENATTARLEAAKRDLAAAKTSGDTNAEIEASAALAKASAEQASIDAWKAANPPKEKKTEAAPPQKQQPEPRQEAPRVDPTTADWLESNRWFVPERGNDEFDPEMHEEAVLYGRRLERQYKAAGKSDQIGGADYFAEINTHMRAEFPDYGWEGEAEPAPRRETPAMSRTSKVAPVRTATTAAAGQRQGGNTKVTLTAAEVQMANSLWTSGAMKFPAGHQKAGQKPANIDEAKLCFALQKIKKAS